VSRGGEAAPTATPDRVAKPEPVRRAAQRADRDEAAAAAVADAFPEELYVALRQGHRVSLRGSGAFFIRPERETRSARPGSSGSVRRSAGTPCSAGRPPPAGRADAAPARTAVSSRA